MNPKVLNKWLERQKNLPYLLKSWYGAILTSIYIRVQTHRHIEPNFEGQFVRF